MGWSVEKRRACQRKYYLAHREEYLAWNRERDQRIQNDPVLRERRNARSRRKYHKDMEQVREKMLREILGIGENSYTPEISDEVDVILEIHGKQMHDDPDRLSTGFMRKLIKKFPSEVMPDVPLRRM